MFIFIFSFIQTKGSDPQNRQSTAVQPESPEEPFTTQHNAKRAFVYLRRTTAIVRRLFAWCNSLGSFATDSNVHPSGMITIWVSSPWQWWHNRPERHLSPSEVRTDTLMLQLMFYVLSESEVTEERIKPPKHGHLINLFAIFVLFYCMCCEVIFEKPCHVKDSVVESWHLQSFMKLYLCISWFSEHDIHNAYLWQALGVSRVPGYHLL